MLSAPTTICWLSRPPSAGDALGSPNWQRIILRMMRFFVRTAYGASPGFYGNAECLSFDLPGPGGYNSNLAA